MFAVRSTLFWTQNNTFWAQSDVFRTQNIVHADRNSVFWAWNDAHAPRSSVFPPGVHAFGREIRKAMVEAYAVFVAAFQEAAEKLRGGD